MATVSSAFYRFLSAMKKSTKKSQQKEQKPMYKPKPGYGNNHVRLNNAGHIERQESHTVKQTRLLQKLALAMLLLCTVSLLIACSTDATTSQPPPAVTPTEKALASPTPSLSEVTPAREGSSMVYDAGMGMALLFGGAAATPVGNLNDTWAWNGQTWLTLHPSTSPLPRNTASIVYDAATGQALLFGGVSDSGNSLGDTWAWDGHTWTQLHPANSPVARDDTAMVYDPANRQVLLFGGLTQQGRIPLALNDTWAWDGHTWNQLHPPTSPPVRFGATMAYDAATGQVILFGGGAGYSLNDTWAWDGHTWTQLHPSTSPPARIHACMVYDAATRQLVLFGGEAAATQLSDTWLWDGTTWVEQAAMPAPSGGYNSATYDAAHQYILVLATTGDKAHRQNKTWIWTGSGWKNLD
jgi:hypothetical protein